MRYIKHGFVIASVVAIVTLTKCDNSLEVDDQQGDAEDVPVQSTGHKALEREGKEIFRFDTFGDEEFWSGLLHLDKAIAGAANGGLGGELSRRTALPVV